MYFNIVYVFDDLNSDVIDIDVEFEIDFVYCKLLEFELIEQVEENFEELDGKFLLIRYE